MLGNSKAASQPTAISVAGEEEPIEPAYYKPVSASPISGQLAIPSLPVGRNGAVVERRQRRWGMRYLYAHGSQRQPISNLGTGPDIGIATWNSSFQPDLIGPIHDAGFNDALFQAGYPGFNLGLSFKVQILPTQLTGPGYGIRMRSSNVQHRIIKNGKVSTSANTVG